MISPCLATLHNLAVNEEQHRCHQEREGGVDISSYNSGREAFCSLGNASRCFRKCDEGERKV